MWRYEGGTLTDGSLDIALTFGQRDPEQIERELYRTVVYLARYLRQPVTWIESLSLDELRKWEEAVSELLSAEGGRVTMHPATVISQERPAARSRPVPGALTTFGEWDGGG